MFRYGRLIVGVLIMISLCSCAPLQDESDVSKYINPQAYGSLVPDQAPSLLLDPDQSAKASLEETDITQIPPQYTLDLPWELSGGYFISNEFTFFVPAAWRDNFSLQPQDRSTSSLEWRSFNFYFVEEETGIEVLMLRIDAMRSSFVDSRGTLGGEELGRNADGDYSYLRMSNPIEDDPDLQSGMAIFNIMMILNDPDQFDFQVVA